MHDIQRHPYILFGMLDTNLSNYDNREVNDGQAQPVDYHSMEPFKEQVEFTVVDEFAFLVVVVQEQVERQNYKTSNHHVVQSLEVLQFQHQ